MNTARYLKMSALAAFAIARLFATITPAMGQTTDVTHAIPFEHRAHMMAPMP